MSANQFNFARFELAKAQCRAAITEKTVELAMLEILQAEGGEIKAITLVEKLIVALNDVDKTPRELCKAIGFEPDEMVGLRRWQ